ncbi:MAG: sulfatase-like hydrolase/transferase [Planctomycetota bacterium]|nr:sulfatase-like hydrolase/transferase [Planctomycetota bacterium]
MSRLRSLCSASALALIACACGTDRAPAARSASIFEGVLEPSAAPRPGARLSELLVAGEAHGWKVEGASRTEVRDDLWGNASHGGAPARPGLGFVARGTVTLTHELTPAEAEANVVEVDLSFWGPGTSTLSAAIVGADGEVLADAPASEVRPGRGMSTRRFTLRRRSSPAGGEVLRLTVSELQGPAALGGARLDAVDPVALTPPHHEPAFVSLGHAAYRAVGLHPRAPMRSAIVVPTDGRLHLAVGRPVSLPPASEVSLRIEGPGGAIERSLATPADGWEDTHVDLAAFGGQLVSVTVEARGGVALLGGGRAVQARGVPPVLLMSSDTHRADHLGTTAAGFELRTPHLDALAARGVQFLQATSTANVTNPSHVAMMTGMHPRDTGITDNETPLAERASTLAEAFQAAGYRTLAVTSAFHLAPSHSGLAQGFDRYSAPLGVTRRGRATLDALEPWIDECAGEPLFVFVHVFDAHSPYRPEAEAALRHLGADPTAASAPARGVDRSSPPALPAWAREPAATASRLRAEAGRPPAPDPERWVPAHLYRAEVEGVDGLLGRLLTFGGLGGGYVAFVSDHGESFGARGVWWDHASMAPDNLGVPLILAGPGLAPTTREDAVQNHRVGATLLELADVSAPWFPGRSLLEPAPGEPLFALSSWAEEASVAIGPWQLTMVLRDCREQSWRAAKVQGEVTLVNLADAEPRPDRLDEEFGRAREMREALLAWLEEAPDEDLAGVAGPLSDAARSGLAELGYGGATTDPGGGLWVAEDADPAWVARFR